jgi:hypothetical protein
MCPWKKTGQVEKCGHPQPDWLLETFMGSCEEFIVVGFSFTILW